VLYRFNGQVNKGRYEYPFEITLPVCLLGKQGFKQPSFRDGFLQRQQPDFFVIEYFLEARLHRYGMMKWDVKNAQEILLSDPPY
jgi:hypothetical protein